MNPAERDVRLSELMDVPDCDPIRLRRTLHRFAIVNAAVSRWGSIYRSHVRPVLGSFDRPARMLDIGSGGGDVLRCLLRLALRDGFRVEAVGIDPNPRALEVACAGPTVTGLSFREARSRTLVERGERFDIVISNHLLHHLDDGAFQALLSDSTALTARLAVHSDIARSRAAYLAFAAAVTPIAPGSFLRIDGLRSIRRSYTLHELEQSIPAGWRAESRGPFRLLAVHRAVQGGR